MAIPFAALAGMSGGGLGGITSMLSGALGNLSTGVKSATGGLTSAFGSMKGSIAGAVSSVGGLGSSAGGALSRLSGLSAAGGVLTGNFASLGGASQMLGGKFSAMVNFASHFVQQLNPGLIQQMNLAFRDVDAVIGRTLRPIIVYATDIIRTFGGSISGALRQFEPIIGKVMSTLRDTLTPVFAALGTVLEGLTPVFDFVADAFSGVGKIIGDIAKYMRPVIEVMIALGKEIAGVIAQAFGVKDLGAGVKGLFENVRVAIQGFIRNLTLVTAMFFKLIGFGAGIEAIIKGLKPKAVEDIRGAAAPQNVSFKAAGDLGKDLQTAIFAAVSGGPKKEAPKAEDLLAGLLDEVKAIQAAGKSDLEKMYGKLFEVAATLAGVLGTAGEIWKTIKDILGKIPNPVAVFNEANEALQGHLDINKKIRDQKAAGGLQHHGGEQRGLWQHLRPG